MVNLTRIYTRTGDDGSTALGDLSRTRKTDLRLAAYADANEANAALGVALACGGLPDDVRAVLLRVQNDLFDVGADLATPLQATYEYPPLRVKDEWVAELEADCDRYLAPLEKLRSFILPGGTPGLGPPAPGPHRRAPRGALHLGGHRGLRHRARDRARRGRGQPDDGHLPQPALGPALRAGPLGERGRRGRRPLGPRRGAGGGARGLTASRHP